MSLRERIILHIMHESMQISMRLDGSGGLPEDQGTCLNSRIHNGANIVAAGSASSLVATDFIAGDMMTLAILWHCDRLCQEFANSRSD